MLCLGAVDEKQSLETQTSDLLEELAKERIELERYKTLLENEKGKVLELQQLHKAEDKSELERLVEHTRSVSSSREPQPNPEPQKLKLSAARIRSIHCIIGYNFSICIL